MSAISRVTCALFGVVGFFSVSAHATPIIGLAPEVIALTGQTAVGTNGGTFGNFFAPVQSDSGSVVFTANLDGGECESRHMEMDGWNARASGKAR